MQNAQARFKDGLGIPTIIHDDDDDDDDDYDDKTIIRIKIMYVPKQFPFKICRRGFNRMYNNNHNDRHHYHTSEDLRLLSLSGLYKTIQKSLLWAYWVPFF